jgi:hypothetical protein
MSDAIGGGDDDPREAPAAGGDPAEAGAVRLPCCPALLPDDGPTDLILI